VLQISPIWGAKSPGRIKPIFGGRRPWHNHAI